MMMMMTTDYYYYYYYYYYYTVILQLTSVVSRAAMSGAMNPEAAAMPLDTPIRVPAYCGAMSMWLTKNPHRETPHIVVDRVISVTARAV